MTHWLSNLNILLDRVVLHGKEFRRASLDFQMLYIHRRREIRHVGLTIDLPRPGYSLRSHMVRISPWLLLYLVHVHDNEGQTDQIS